MTCTKTGSKNDLFLNCQRKMKELSKKELSNVTPASIRYPPPPKLSVYLKYLPKRERLLIRIELCYWKSQIKGNYAIMIQMINVLCLSLFSSSKLLLRKYLTRKGNRQKDVYLFHEDIQKHCLQMWSNRPSASVQLY